MSCCGCPVVSDVRTLSLTKCFWPKLVEYFRFSWSEESIQIIISCSFTSTWANAATENPWRGENWSEIQSPLILVCISWYKIEVAVFALAPLSFRKRKIGAAHTYQACRHSQSPNGACSTWAAGLGETGCPWSSLEKEATEVPVRGLRHGAGGWFLSCY